MEGKETAYRYVEGFDPYVPAGAGYSFYGNKERNGGKAVIWARPYEPPPEIPDEQYPFWLDTGRVLEHWHTGSLTRRVKQLHQAVPAAYVEIHPDDARRLGITEGQTVRLITRRGQLDLPVQIDGRGKPLAGSVFVPFFDEGKLINRLTLDVYDPISKQPDYKKCAVRIEKIAV